MPHIVRRPINTTPEQQEAAVVQKVKDEVMPRYYEIAQMELQDINDGIFKECLQDAYFTIWALVDIIDRLRDKR